MTRPRRTNPVGADAPVGPLVCLVIRSHTGVRPYFRADSSRLTNPST